MDCSKIQFIRLDKAAKIPKVHSDGAAGYDLYSVCDAVVPPLATLPLKLGFALKMPPNLFGYLCGRSGIARNNGVSVVNSYIRSDDEVTILLKNYTTEPFAFQKEMRIAQVFFAIIDDRVIEEVNKTG